MSPITIPDTIRKTVAIKLTQREMEVLTLIMEGRSSREVADVLSMARRTVGFHLNNIYGKLQVKNRVEALFRATRLGLVPSEWDGNEACD